MVAMAVAEMEPQSTMMRILLVDDHDVVRKGLRLLLETEFECNVIEASSAKECIAYAADPDIDLVLLDVRLPDGDPQWIIGKLRQARREVPILMISTYANEKYVEEALEAGANGYLLKEASVHQLREAVDTAVGRRGLYLHPTVAARMVARRRDPGNGDSLSEREIKVLGLLVEGATNEELAAALYLSEKTVKSHLSSIFRKLEVANRTQAVAKALRERIVPMPGD